MHQPVVEDDGMQFGQLTVKGRFPSLAFMGVQMAAINDLIRLKFQGTIDSPLYDPAPYYEITIRRTEAPKLQ